jgi:hypothetical protein
MARLLLCAALLAAAVDADVAAASTATATAPTANNRRTNLLPPVGGAWRGAELGSQFIGSGGGGIDPCAAKLAGYKQQYPAYPLHVYRTFSDGMTVGAGVRAWVARGGILWYNIKTSKQMSWQTGADGGFNTEAKLWAAQVRSLAPAQVFVTIYHEPDHNVCFENCTKGGVPGNSPANYRNMW